MSAYSARWKGEPLQFRFFPLSPESANKQGHEVLYDPAEQGRSFIPEHRAMIWICSPYLTAEAFDWLTMAVPAAQKHDLFLITSEINDPKSGTHAINQWAQTGLALILRTVRKGPIPVVSCLVGIQKRSDWCRQDWSAV